MTGIDIPCVSPQQILEDLTDCVTTCPMKVQKRLNRLRVVCRAMNMDPDVHLSTLILAEERNMSVSSDAILEYIYRPPCSQDDLMVEWMNEGYDDTIKKIIEAELTSRLNTDLTLYRITCGLALRIFKRVKRHSILGSLVEDRRILFIHKGGIAQRLVLVNSFPDYKDDIETYFGFGGDNDCNLFVDPELENYDEIRSLLVQFVHQQMMALVSTFSCGTVDVRAKQITSITVHGVYDSMEKAIDLKNAIVRDFEDADVFIEEIPMNYNYYASPEGPLILK